MEIYVVRHGETDLNVKQIRQGWLDAPLNQAGRDLAVLTGQAMRGVSFDACFSSPLIRARETVEIILRESGNGSVPIRTDDRLKEIHFGSEEGMPSSESLLPPETARMFFLDSFGFPGFPEGESIPDVCRRTGDFFRELIAENSAERVLIGTHGCALRAMMNPFYEHPEHFWQGCVPPNCAVTLVEVKEGAARIMEKDRIYYDPSLLVDHFSNIVRD